MSPSVGVDDVGAAERGDPLVDKDLPGGRGGVVGTAMMVVCQMAGMGILQLPYTLAQSGWVCLAIIVSCAAATNFTGKLLIRCCYDENGARIRRSYAEVGQAAFGAVGRSLAQAFEGATLFGVSALFLILAGKFLEELFATLTSRQWSLVAAALVVLPILALRTVVEMKALPIVGVIATLAVVAAVLVEAARSQNEQSPSNVGPTDVFVLGGLAPAFSGMTLAFAAHAGLPTIEAGMREPVKFGYALNLGYGLVMAMYLPVAIAGYAIYGNKVYSPVLCSLPHSSVVQVAAKVLVTAHVVLTYPVLMTLFLMELERVLDLQPGARLYLAKRSVLRAVMVAATAGLAIGVPYFDTMISFVSALCVVMTTFVLPAAFFLKLKARSTVERILPVLIALLGIIGGGVGVVQAGIELVHKVATHADPNDG